MVLGLSPLLGGLIVLVLWSIAFIYALRQVIRGFTSGKINDKRSFKTLDAKANPVGFPISMASYLIVLFILLLVASPYFSDPLALFRS